MEKLTEQQHLNMLYIQLMCNIYQNTHLGEGSMIEVAHRHNYTIPHVTVQKGKHYGNIHLK